MFLLSKLSPVDSGRSIRMCSDSFGSSFSRRARFHSFVSLESRQLYISIYYYKVVLSQERDTSDSRSQSLLLSRRHVSSVNKTQRFSKGLS
ncbi:unnamed protein product [Brassica oleracea var. botrytis]